VFVGEFVGAFTFGPLSDRYGRWWISVIGATFVGVMGLASAFAWSFESLAVMRCLVGVGIGGLSVPFDILAEFVPVLQRGRSLMAVEFFWSIGTLFTAGLAWGLLEELGWRWFVGLCSAPVLMALVGFCVMPESPHWLVTQGRTAEALCVMQRAAKLNGRAPLADDTVLVAGSEAARAPSSVPNPVWTKPIEGTHTDAVATVDSADTAPPQPQPTAPAVWDTDKVGSGASYGAAVESTPSGNSGSASPRELFRSPLLWTTLRLFAVWLCFSFSYYGVLLILPEVLSGGEDNLDYTALLISSSAEVVACAIGMALIDTVGRTKTAGVSYGLCGVFMGLMMLSNLTPAAVIALSMLARGAIFIGSSTTWVLTPELFPTYVALSRFLVLCTGRCDVAHTHQPPSLRMVVNAQACPRDGAQLVQRACSCRRGSHAILGTGRPPTAHTACPLRCRIRAVWHCDVDAPGNSRQQTQMIFLRSNACRDGRCEGRVRHRRAAQPQSTGPRGHQSEISSLIDLQTFPMAMEPPSNNLAQGMVHNDGVMPHDFSVIPGMAPQIHHRDQSSFMVDYDRLPCRHLVRCRWRNVSCSNRYVSAIGCTHDMVNVLVWSTLNRPCVMS
jgi:hypothetical protein